MFQVLLVGSSLWCGRCACVSSKGGLLVSRTSKGGNIFLSISCRDTTLLEDALALPLDLMLVTVVHCWLSTISGWTHIISPCGVRTGMRPFSFWLWGSVLITLSSLFGMEPLRLVLVGDSVWIELVILLSYWRSPSSVLDKALTPLHRSEPEGHL